MFFTVLSMVLYALIPILLYLNMIYIFAPHNSIDYKRGYAFLGLGTLSIIILFRIQQFFPGFLEWKFLQYGFDFIKQKIYAYPGINSLAYRYFIQVGMVEELSKMLSFLIILKVISYLYEDFKTNRFNLTYCMIAVGLAFSCLENVMYVGMYSSSVFLIRAVASTLLHLTCATIMGYYLSYNYNKLPVKNKTNLDIFLKNNWWGRKLYIFVVALLLPTLLHGLFDFNLSVAAQISPTIHFVIMGLCVYINYRVYKALVKDYTSTTQTQVS